MNHVHRVFPYRHELGGQGVLCTTEQAFAEFVQQVMLTLKVRAHHHPGTLMGKAYRVKIPGTGNYILVCTFETNEQHYSADRVSLFCMN